MDTQKPLHKYTNIYYTILNKTLFFSNRHHSRIEFPKGELEPKRMDSIAVYQEKIFLTLEADNSSEEETLVNTSDEVHELLLGQEYDSVVFITEVTTTESIKLI